MEANVYLMMLIPMVSSQLCLRGDNPFAERPNVSPLACQRAANVILLMLISSSPLVLAYHTWPVMAYIYLITTKYWLHCLYRELRRNRSQWEAIGPEEKPRVLLLLTGTYFLVVPKGLCSICFIIPIVYLKKKENFIYFFFIIFLKKTLIIFYFFIFYFFSIF